MYNKSLKIYEIISYLRSFWLGSFISILFLKFVWLNDVDIGIFHFILWALIFLLEIPTWSFSDKYGYRRSIILAFLFLSLAFLSFLVAIIFWKYIIFIFTALFFALNSSFSSWAEKSYLFTIFRYEKKEKEYLKYKTKISRNTRIIQWFAIIIWAYLYSYIEYIPYLIQFFLIFWAFILSFFLKEEPIHRKGDNIEWNIKQSLKNFFNKKVFLYFLIFLLFATIPYEYFHHVINQSIFLETWMNVKQIWIAWVLIYIISWFLIHFSPVIWKFFWEFYSYLFLVGLSLIAWISFLFSPNFFYIILISSILYFARESKNIFLDNSIQFRIKEDKQRATTISIFSMLSNLPIKMMFIFFWIWFVDFSYVEIMSILAWFFWFLSVIFLISFLRKNI